MPAFGTESGTMGGMTALNVEFTSDELGQIREAARREGTSMKKIAHDAVVTDLHRRRVAASAVRVAGIYAGLNKRLADK